MQMRCTAPVRRALSNHIIFIAPGFIFFEKRPSLYEQATRSSAIAILGAGGLRYDGASRAGAGTLPPGPTAGHARRANRASTRFTSVEQASEEGVEEGVKWALSQLAAP